MWKYPKYQSQIKQVVSKQDFPKVPPIVYQMSQNSNSWKIPLKSSQMAKKLHVAMIFDEI